MDFFWIYIWPVLVILFGLWHIRREALKKRVVKYTARKLYGDEGWVRGYYLHRQSHDRSYLFTEDETFVPVDPATVKKVSTLW